MTWKKRIISIVLCLCALLCAASVRADAADHTNHLVCGGTTGTTCTHAGEKHTSNVTWTAWNGTGNITYTNNVAYIYLSDDVTLQGANPLTVPKDQTLYLCLNGHSIEMKHDGGYWAIDVEGGNLILCDCKNTGTITQVIGNSYKGRGVKVEKKDTTGGKFTMYGGSITGNKGGVEVGDGCTFTMYGGSITQNAAGDDSGGGVYVYKNGTFTMYNGEISHNSAYIGGGVYNKGKFTMSNGMIVNNTAKSDGGGVHNDGGEFTMSDGEISGNSSENFAGGVRNLGKFTMSGGKIINNTAANNGGGVHNYNGTFNISGNVTITGNKKGSVANNVYLSSGKTITLAGALGENASIHVTTSKTPSSSPYFVDITAANDPNLVTAAKNKFTYDNEPSRDIVTRENGTILAVCKHSYGSKWTQNTDASSGHWRKCTNCDTIETATHSWNGGAVTTPATCTTPGEKTFTCTACSATKTETIGAKGHDFSVRQYGENDHWMKCSRCDATDTKEAHSGGEATCTQKAVCEKCGQKYGGLKAHDFANGPYQYDGEQHWKKCANCDATDTKKDHTGGTATCTKKAECSVCGQEYGDLKAHDFANGPYQYDGEQHWKKCANCDATDTKEAHTGGEATCTQKAVCEKCGQKYGDLKAHDFANGPYQYDGEQHWKKCANCDAIDTKVDHTGGTASCTAKAKCSVCGQEYGGLKAHDFANGPYRYDGEQHWKKCANCDAIDTKVDHTGGKASCTEKAKCSVCGQEYGGLKAHDFANGPYQYDGEQHWKKCANCDAIDTKVDHTGGTASCTAKAKCSVCGQEYGGLKAHDFANGPYQYDGEQHWKKCANCDAIDTKVDHTGGTASCTAKAKCSVCGQEYGGLKAHDFANGPYRYDGEQHWKKCANCDAIDTKVDHTGGKASCTEKAKCSVCGQEYGGLKAHDFANGPYQYDGEQHWKKCANCDAIDTKVDHTGGTASCTAKAKCSVCGQEYGGLKAHDFANGPYQYDGEQHWYKCANCTATTESVAHTDFTAWKSDRSGHWHECSTCGYKTAVNAHTPDRDKATETTPQLCTECGYVIAPATHPVHTWVFVAETPATCNAAGEREHYKCTCGRTSFKNGDVYDINEDASVLTIAANHTGNIGEQWHSDSANHWQEYTCCHARANETAHSGGAATCTAQAVCQVCGKAYGPLAAHAWQPATCTAPKTCTACHVTDGAALGHDWGAWKVTTPATKDAPGVETRTCAHNSAHTETRSIPKLSTAVYTVSEDTKIAQIEAKVDGLDKILESNENKALVNDGKSVGVSLTVKNTASSGVSEKIKEKLAGSNLVGLRLELTVEKTVTANGVVEWKQTILDAGVLLKTTITLPAELQGKSGYVVYRLHDGNVHVLTETANENEEFISVSADKTQITICARLYSEYVIAYQTGGSSGGGYQPVNPTPVKATSANTGDAGVLLYGVTAALSLTGTAWLGAKSRKH